jgi:hypothetical protein
MLQVEFEPIILVFERAQTVHALDSAANVICMYESRTGKLIGDFR